MKKKNKYFMIIVVVFLISIGVFSIINRKENSQKKEILYQGNQLFINVDGTTSTNLPTTGTYYLTNYECDNINTEVTWNSSSYELSVSNGKEGGSVSCDLEFKSNPNLSEMPVGSYVAYVGSGGTVGTTSVACQTNGEASSSTETDVTEAPNSCLGQNAREDLDTSNYTYGYCYYAYYRYYTTGWRIAYIDNTDTNNPKTVIVSAGSPECNTRESIEGNTTYIKQANAYALKYCNSNYVDGNCSCTVDSTITDGCSSPSTDAWAVNDTDFYYMTKAISGYGKRLTSSSSSLGDSGGALGTSLYCYAKYSYQECGYNNDLIDNGGLYWFAAQNSSSSALGVIWDPIDRYVYYYAGTNAYGLRPVISLSSTVYVTGGEGTMSDPYTIANDTFILSNGAKYLTEDQKNSVELTLVSKKANTMCISVNDSNCSNYVDFSNTYNLDWSDEEDGEKVVYVYYKDSEGTIFASITKSIMIDTTAPTNNSVSIGEGAGLTRTLTIASDDASTMCFSNTSSEVSNCTNWLNYATSYKWRLSDGTGSKTVYAFFKDEAGNVSSTTATVEVTSIVEFVVNEDFTDTTYDSNITVTDGDTYPWSVVDGQFQSTSQAVNSSTSSSTISFTPTVDAVLSFDYGVSSEGNYDKLTITLTGSDSSSSTLVNAISGTKTGSIIEISLTAGVTYTLTLSYTKDSSSNSGSDIGYIDNLIINS